MIFFIARGVKFNLSQNSALRSDFALRLAFTRLLYASCLTRLFGNNSGVFCQLDGVYKATSRRPRTTLEVISYDKYSKNKAKYISNYKVAALTQRAMSYSGKITLL